MDRVFQMILGKRETILDRKSTDCLLSLDFLSDNIVVPRNLDMISRDKRLSTISQRKTNLVFGLRSIDKSHKDLFKLNSYYDNEYSLMEISHDISDESFEL